MFRVRATVTVFSLHTCRYCVEAKHLLSERNIPYTETCVDDSPAVLEAMRQLTNFVTVPQIFFNNTHVGGCEELKKLFSQPDGLARAKELLEAPPTDLDARLVHVEITKKGKHDNVSVLRSLSRGYTLGKVSMTYGEVMHTLHAMVNIKDRSYHMRTYPRCFVGSELVTAILRNTEYGATTRSEAVYLGNQLLQSGVIAHVCKEHNFKDEYLFYRCHSDEQPLTLNGALSPSQSSPEEGVDTDEFSQHLVIELSDRFNTLREEFTVEGGKVDYKSLSKSFGFYEFLEFLSDLRRIELSTFKNISHKIAFLINVYNLMIKVAFAKVGIPESDLKRYHFFDYVSFYIGNDLYSFNDIENGLLRGNKVPPAHLRCCIRDTKRLQHVLSPEDVDCRIHFALNCGAGSCPPVKLYTGGSLDNELDLAAKAFLQSSKNFQVENVRSGVYNVTMSMILKWYERDFGKNSHEAVVKLSALVGSDPIPPTGQITVKYFPYDWSTDASDSLQYQGSFFW
eukprot:PhF_6_TR20469/c0_g1_i1/m.29443